MNKKNRSLPSVFDFGNPLLGDHLGNVRATLSDYRKVGSAQIVNSATDYYPFGMVARSFSSSQTYRFGFNGQEHLDDITVGDYDLGKRMYDPRLARLLSIDPLAKGYPWYTPYQFAGNTPIQAIDLLGEQPAYITRKYLSHPNSGAIYPGDSEWDGTIKLVTEKTVNVAALLKDKDVHGGILELTFDKPGGQLVKAEWKGYKKESFVDKTFKASPYHDALEANNDGMNAGVDAPDAVGVGASVSSTVLTGSASVTFVPSDGFKGLDFKLTGAVDAKIPDAGLAVFIDQYKFAATYKGNKTDALNGIQHNEGVNVNIFGLSKGAAYNNNNPSDGVLYTSTSTSFGLTAGIPGNVSKGQSATIGAQSMYKYIMQNLGNTAPKTPVPTVTPQTK